MYNNPFSYSPSEPKEQIQDSTVTVSADRQATHNANDILVNLVLRLSRTIDDEPNKNIINLGGNDYGISLYISPLDKVQALPSSKQIISGEQEKPTAIEFPEHIMLTHISRSLLRMIRTDGSAKYRFSFAYRIDNNGVIYASLNLPVDKVTLNGKNCRVMLGNYDTEYICELSKGGTVTLTAAVIEDLYRKKRERYIAKIKERRLNKHDMTEQ